MHFYNSWHPVTAEQSIRYQHVVQHDNHMPGVHTCTNKVFSDSTPNQLGSTGYLYIDMLLGGTQNRVLRKSFSSMFWWGEQQQLCTSRARS